METTVLAPVRTHTRVISIFLVVSLLLVFLTAYTKYIFAKDYLFYIETSCDPATENCFVRDCDDYCPPNGLETYRSFYITAAYFQHCTNNSCKNICLNTATASHCSEIVCDPTNEEATCSTVEE